MCLGGAKICLNPDCEGRLKVVGNKAANWFSQISRYLDNWHHLAP